MILVLCLSAVLLLAIFAVGMRAWARRWAASHGHDLDTDVEAMKNRYHRTGKLF